MRKFKVLLSDQVYPSEFFTREEILCQAKEQGLEIELVSPPSASPEDMIEAGWDADAIIHFLIPLTDAFISRLIRCKLIVQIGIGVDSIDVASATKHGVGVANVPDYCVEEVATHALALFLCLVRNVAPRNAAIRNGGWRIKGENERYYLPRLSNKVFALVGFGNIARQFARKVKPLVREVWAYDPYLPAAVFKEAGVRQVADLTELWKNADCFSISVPMSKGTYHLVNRDAFALMKPTAILINTSRGPVVDEQALCDALESRRIAAAGLDVFEQEPLPPRSRLRRLDHVVLTAHQGSVSEESLPQLMQTVLDEVFRALKREPVHGILNSVK